MYEDSYKYHNVSKNISMSSSYFQKNMYKIYIGSKKIKFDIKKIDVNLFDIISARKTNRNFEAKSIDLADLGTILYYSMGINGVLGDDYDRRFVPSAGARYPINTYIISYNCNGLEEGLFHYNVKENLLQKIREAPDREVLYRIICSQDFAKSADVFLLFTATFESTMSKYGERGYRYLYLDAGHIAQNVVLIATALGIKNTLIGGFEDNLIDNVLNINPVKESVIYMCAIGK